MRKHLLGMALFVLIVGVTVYFYSPDTPPASQPQIVVKRLPAQEPMAPSVVLDLVKREATVSFNSRAGISDEVWASVEFFSPDADAPRWTTPTVRLTPSAANHETAQVSVAMPCEPCRSIAPPTNYYARVMVSATPDQEVLLWPETTTLVPVLLKHR